MSASTDLIKGRTPVQGGDVSCKNTDAVAMVEGQCVKIDATNPMSATQPVDGVLLTTAVTDTPYGLVVEAIPVNGIGRVQRLGIGKAIAAGAITAGATVGASAAVAGRVTTYTAGDPSLGVALDTTTTAGDPIRVALQPSKNA